MRLPHNMGQLGANYRLRRLGATDPCQHPAEEILRHAVVVRKSLRGQSVRPRSPVTGYALASDVPNHDEPVRCFKSERETELAARRVNQNCRDFVAARISRHVPTMSNRPVDWLPFGWARESENLGPPLGGEVAFPANVIERGDYFARIIPEHRRSAPLSDKQLLG